MAQRRYVAPAYRNLGSTKSRIWQTVNNSPRAAQLWREIFLRAEALMAQGVSDDPDIVAEDREVQMLVAELEVDLWKQVWAPAGGAK